MTRIVEFHQYGGPQVLRVRRGEAPKPAAGEVVVAMRALALNRANTLFRQGNYLFQASFPSRIGAEGVGVIESLGAEVAGFEVGRRVNLLPPDDESTGGYAADAVAVPAAKLLPAPDALDDRHAATAWVPFLTLYHLFVERRLAAPGRWIVLPAASSSVSLAANALARHLGAKTIGITRTAAKHASLEAAGYDALIVAGEEPDITARLVEIAGGGADLVFDPVGGDQLASLVAGVKPGAEIVVYGLLDPAGTSLPIFQLMQTGARLSCYTLYELLSDPSRLQAAIDYFLPLFEDGSLRPVADDKRYGLDEIADAFTHLESNTQFGKVIVTI